MLTCHTCISVIMTAPPGATLMILSPHRPLPSLLIISVLSALTPVSCLATLYWDADGSPAGNNTSTGAGLGGTGSWDAAGKWFDGVSADVSWPGATDAV